MPQQLSTDQSLRAENAELRARLEEAEEKLRAISDISELQHAEAALQLTNERLTLALKCSQVVLFQQDLELRYTWHRNPELGLKFSDFIGKRDADLMERAADAAVTEGLKREVIRTGVGQRQEVLVHIQGVDRHYDLLVEPQWDAAGLISGVTCAAIDITARKETEAARQLTNERLTLAVKCSRVVLFQQDLELRYTWLLNSAPGWDDSYCIGKRNADLVDLAEDAAVVDALKREVIRTGVGQRAEIAPQVQGAVRHFDLTVEPLRDAAGLVCGVTCASIEITERKRAEQALRESERNYRALAAASSEVAYRMSADWSTMLPLDGRQLVASADQPVANWAWLDLNVPHDEHLRVRQAISETIAGKTLFELEHRVLRPDGSIGWTFSRAVPILDENGEVTAWFGAASDITVRKQAEEERRLLASIVEYSRDFIGISDTHGNPIYGNRAAMELVGLQDLEQMRRSKIIDYFIPEQRPFVEEVVLPAVFKGGRWSGELTMQHFVTGATFPVWYDLFRVDDPVTGQPVNFATITRDLTESKRIEQALADRTELLNGVLEGTTDVIFVKDLNGRVLLANAAFAAAARSTPEQLVGKRDEELFPPDVAAEIRQHDEAVIAGGSPIQIEETIPVAGEARVFLTLKAPLRDGSGRVIGILGISRDITERNRAEEALRESESRFRAAVGAVSSLIWTNNSRGEMEGEQPGWGRFTGQSEEEYQGYGWARAVHPEDAQPTIDGWNQAVAEKRMFEFEHRVRRNDGEWRLCSIRAVPVLGEAGEIREWVGVHTDITERKQTELALRESEERIQQALRVSDSFTFEWCLETDRVRRSASAGAILHLAGEAAVSDTSLGYFQRIHPEDRERFVALLTSLRADARDYTVDYRVVRADGVVVSLEEIGRGNFDTAGKLVRLEGVATDATRRRQAEAALRAGEEHMRLATEATEVGIWEWNLVTNAIRWDAQMFRLYGVPPTEDSFVHYETWCRAVLPEDLARQEEVLQDTVRRLGKSTREFRILRADNGERRWIQAVETVRANEEGKAEWVIGTNLDVTEQKNAERAIREEAQRKDEFLAMLGHELRNPLNAIRHAVQISGETPDDAEACQWAANVIDRQSQQLSRMVDDLLDVARINRGRIELRVESLDLGPVLEQAIAAARPLHAQRRQTFTSDIGSPLRVTGDAARLEQVFVNLLTNAAKYTPENGRISLHAQNEDGEIVVTITDTGVGIPAELLPHVFDLFRQADSTLDRALGGLGIGLSVVKSLVEMHLGRVTIASAGANAGTTVTVRLPLLLELPATERPPAPRALDAAPSPILRVLIVDDHEDAAQALGRLLKRRGCEVRCAYSGPDGVTAAREFRPEVLLLDLGLPGFDGYELARRLRAEAPFAEAIFIAISGYAQDGDRARCLAADFDDHFAKPLDFPKLMEVIHTGNPPRLEPTVSKQSNHKVE